MANIMIVDDSGIMRKKLNMILSGAGHTIVAEATNGEESYEMYQIYKPQIVTMDITMPIMDGIEATKKILKDFPEANIIIISAISQQQMVYEAIKNGAKNYILKPINIEKMNGVIKNLLDNESKEGKKEVAFSVINNSGGVMVKVNREFNDEEESNLGKVLYSLRMLDSCNFELYNKSGNEKLSDKLLEIENKFIELNEEKKKAFGFYLKNQKGVILPVINDNFNRDRFFEIVEGLCYLNPLVFKLDENSNLLPKDILLKLKTTIKHFGGVIK